MPAYIYVPAEAKALTREGASALVPVHSLVAVDTHVNAPMLFMAIFSSYIACCFSQRERQYAYCINILGF